MKWVLPFVLTATLNVCGEEGPTGAMSVGDQQEGNLTADDFDETYGVIADVVPVRYPGGSPVAVVVTSREIDPFAIVVSRQSPIGADGGLAGGGGACVILDAPHPLEVALYVSSAGAAPYGAYSVSLLDATDEVIAEHDCQTGAPPQDDTQGGTLTQVSRSASALDGERALTDS